MRALLMAVLLAAGCENRSAPPASAPESESAVQAPVPEPEAGPEIPWSGLGLDQDPELKAQVLGQTFRQVAERFGPVRYDGTVGLRLVRNGHDIDHQERGRIEMAEGGDVRVRQWSDEDRLLREAIRVDGLWHVRNGQGALRRADYIQNRRIHPDDEVYSGLAAFADQLGPALRLKAEGSEGTRVRYRAVPGSGPAPAGEVDRVEGSLVVDRGSGVPLEGHLRAELSVQGDEEPGELVLTVDFKLRSAQAEPFDISEAVDPIVDRRKAHDPIAFLKGDTRTSTVIGGD